MARFISRRVLLGTRRRLVWPAATMSLVVLVLFATRYTSAQAEPLQVIPSDTVQVEYAQQDRLAIIYAVQTSDGIHWGLDREAAVKLRALPESQTELQAAKERRATLPVQIRRVEDQLQISRGADLSSADSKEANETRFHVLTFQRRGDQSAYGVYGLHREKRLVTADLPLDGVPINWPLRTAPVAAAHLLTLSGLEDRFAEAAIAAHWETWGASGLRVLFVCSAGKAAIFPGVELRDSTQVVCIVWDVYLPSETPDN